MRDVSKSGDLSPRSIKGLKRIEEEEGMEVQRIIKFKQGVVL